MHAHEVEEAHLVLDWHPDLRTRCNLALREYLSASGIPDQRVLVLNIEGSDRYIIYSEHRMTYYGEFLFSNFKEERKPLFTAEYRRNPDWKARFCHLKYHEIAWSYAMLEQFSPYCLDDQPVGTAWQPVWGVSIINSDLEYPVGISTGLETRLAVGGVIYECHTYDENYENPDLVNGMFLPFDYRCPPAEQFVGCEVDGTFFLLYNHLTKDQVESTR